MKTVTKRMKIFFCGILISIFITSFSSIKSQSNFIRDDNFDIQGIHELWVPSDPNNFDLSMNSDSEFPLFKLHIIKEKLNLFDAGGRWIATRYKVVIDGVTVQDWTSAGEMTISHNFPNPPNGISANHTYNIQVDYVDLAGDPLPTKSDNVSVTIFAKPKVYKDSDNNAFVQLRNEDATNKIPVLMVEGFDPVNEKFPEVYYNLTWELINTDLYPNGYEVFILNFNNGGRDLRLNAEVLLKAIEKVHEICPNYKIALAGLSMGGTIGRYALAKEEHYGGTHNVGLFVSYDSPQDGAHVNPGLQDWVKIQNPNEGAISELQVNLQSVAAKQMLRYNTYDPDKIYRLAFYNEMNSYNGDGYPHQSYNVSVSNGNLEATYGYDQIGRHFMTLKINDNLIYAVPAVQMDCGTGSTITDITTKRYGDIFNNPFIHIWYELEILYNPAYQPTWSALDLVNWNEDPLGNIISYDRTKFDSYVVQTIPLQHHQLSKITRDSINSWLNRNSNITVNYNLAEGGSVSPDNYQVQILHGLPVTIQPKTINVNGKQITYIFSHWEDGNTNNPRTLYASNTTIMKGINVSNNPNTFANNSQRKFIQTPDGVKHICYESMGKVWYELSTDNGATWILGNGGKPLSSTDAKNPSMSFYGYQIGIVWQEKSGSSFKIKMALFSGSNYSSSVFSTVADDDLGLDYSHNANPVIAWGYNGKIVVVWSGFDLCTFAGGTKLKYAYGSAVLNDITWYMQCGIDGTNANSINPTIAALYSVYTNPFYFHIAWEQVVNTSTSKINYSTLSADANNYLQHTAFEEVSNNSGYSKNYQPNILIRKVGDYYLPYVTWMGYRITPSVANNVMMRYKQYGSWSPISVYGNNTVQSFSVNNAGLLGWQEVLGLGWSEPIYTGSSTYFNKAVKVGSSNNINTLSTNGKHLQINNSSSYSNMNVNSFQSSSSPYSFVLSQPFSSLSKENSLSIFNGRGGVVGKDDAQFFFALGDILVNGQKVEFVDIPDSINLNNLEVINKYLESNPVTVNANSSLTYGVEYGIVDSVLCSAALSNNGNINFKVEIVDNKTGEVLDVFDEVNYLEKNVFQFDNLGYQINLNGIGERTIKLRLAINTNSNFDFSIFDRISDQSMLAKTSYQTIAYQGPMVVTNYALEQNYPNPFNPSTKISWQSPVGSHQILKVYDILGNEVATLVDEYREAGRYEINFDASNLASGVYIYKIQAGEFTASKKLILLK